VQPTTRSLARHCTTCGEPLRRLPDAQFCEACGAPLEHPDPPRPTGYLRRIAALTADWLLLLAIAAPAYVWIESLDTPNADEAALYAVGNVVMYGTPFLYWALVPALWGGRTLGRGLFRIRIARAGDGAAVSYGRALGRSMFVVLLLITLIPILVDLLLPLWGKHQSICDRVTDTVVTPLMIACDGNGRASGTNDAAAVPAG
jgi:hypothetical protein